VLAGLIVRSLEASKKSQNDLFLALDDSASDYRSSDNCCGPISSNAVKSG
jgi:hypothetical protein